MQSDGPIITTRSYTVWQRLGDNEQRPEEALVMEFQDQIPKDAKGDPIFSGLLDATCVFTQTVPTVKWEERAWYCLGSDDNFTPTSHVIVQTKLVNDTSKYFVFKYSTLDNNRYNKYFLFHFLRTRSTTYDSRMTVRTFYGKKIDDDTLSLAKELFWMDKLQYPFDIQ